MVVLLTTAMFSGPTVIASVFVVSAAEALSPLLREKIANKMRTTTRMPPPIFQFLLILFIYKLVLSDLLWWNSGSLLPCRLRLLLCGLRLLTGLYDRAQRNGRRGRDRRACSKRSGLGQSVARVCAFSVAGRQPQPRQIFYSRNGEQSA